MQCGFAPVEARCRRLGSPTHIQAGRVENALLFNRFCQVCSPNRAVAPKASSFRCQLLPSLLLTKCRRTRQPRKQCAATATLVTAVTPAAAPVSSALAKVVAVVLGYTVLVGACFRSVPQIMKMVKHTSAEGLSLMSYLVELLCYTITLSYNVTKAYAFNTYGEVFALWLQDIVLVALILVYSRHDLRLGALGAVVFAGMCTFLFQGHCPIGLLESLQLSTVIGLSIGSRLPQILLNIKRGDAGMLSVATCALNVVGNVIRMYTTLVLTKDVILLFGTMLQGAMNAILLYQSWQTGKKPLGQDDAPPSAAFKPQAA